MADLISAISNLLWPLLVIVLLLVYGRQLLSKLNDSDDVTLEIGGQRLNFKQMTDQQSDMITDLQHEVASLKRRMDDAGPETVAHQNRPADERVTTNEDVRPLPPAVHSILWVDDHPENNAVVADSWRRDGADVDVARSTSEAMQLLDRRRYGLIISDMGRHESQVDVPDAGLRLLAQVRAADPATPFVLYGNVEQVADTARGAGASMVTGSTFELMDYASSLGMLSDA
ncbi:response regulator [Myceligenerans cantabricum]